MEDASTKKLLSLALAALLLAIAACGKPALPAVNPPLVLGEKYLADLDYEQALLQFDQAIAIEPKNARGYLGKADALLHLGRQAEAASALDTGTKATGGEARAALYEAKIEVEKSAVDGYIGLSSAYAKLDWREIALALLQRVCGELPEESRLREALGRFDAALENTTAETLAPPTGLSVPEQRPVRVEHYTPEGNMSYAYTCEYERNALGQVIESRQIFDSGTTVNTLEYDSGGRMARMDSRLSSGKAGNHLYTYDDAGQLIREDYTDWDGIHSTYEYSYDANGHPARKINYRDGSPNGYYTSYVCNPNGTVARADTYYPSGELFYYELREY